jgi:hypothetical protein
MIENDNIQTKMRFWISWSITNAIGLGFAWSLGELVGQHFINSFGWKTGQIIGIIVFEVILWTFRATVLLQMKSYEILRPLEIFIWATTEVFGWIISEYPVPENSLMGLTGGAIFATSFAAMIWLILWLIKIPKPHSKTWGLQAFIWTFLGLVGGSSLLSLFQTISLVVGEFLSKMYLPIIGMAVAGVILGFSLGGLTGMALIRIIRWPAKNL